MSDFIIHYCKSEKKHMSFNDQGFKQRLGCTKTNFLPFFTNLLYFIKNPENPILKIMIFPVYDCGKLDISEEKVHVRR